MSSTLEQLTCKNIGYNSVAKVLVLASSAVSNVILGRCLAASDYGIISFAAIFISFIQNFSDVGIGPALIQKKELDRSTLNTAFTLKFLLGCAVVAAAFASASLAPLFFDNPRIAVIIRLMSLTFLIGNISFLPNTLLMREMDFKKIAIAETTLSFLHSLVAVLLALKGYGYWSIVVASLTANSIAAVMLVAFKPVAVRFQFDRKVAAELINVGGYLFLTGLLTFTIFNLDNFVVGVVRGSKELGYYAVAFTWGSTICGVMQMVVLRAIFPYLTKVQDEEENIRNTYLKTLEFSAYLVVLVNTALIIVSKDFLIGVLGHDSNKWLPALNTLRILCVYGIVRGLLEPVGSVIIAKGRTKLLMISNVVASAIEVAALYPALKYFGIEGVACAVTGAYLSQYAIYYRYLKKELNIRASDLLKAVRPSMLAAMPLAIYAILPLDFNLDATFGFFVKGVATVVVYLVALGFATRWQLVRQVKEKMAVGA